jgi:hypothetical protein
MELNVDYAIELTQAGEARLAREKHAGQQQKQKPFHRELPVNGSGQLPNSVQPNSLAGGGPVSTSTCASQPQQQNSDVMSLTTVAQKLELDADHVRCCVPAITRKTRQLRATGKRLESNR